MAPQSQFTKAEIEKAATYGTFFYRQLFVQPPPLPADTTRLNGKTAIVTGSNTGIGLDVARQLLDLGLRKLIIAVRNATKGKTAAKELSKGRKDGSFEIEVWDLDLSSYQSVTDFAERAKTLTRLDIAVLNAGIYKKDEAFHPTTHVDENVQINYLATVLLASLLLPTLKRATTSSSPSRLVFTSSDTALRAKFVERTSRPLLDAFKEHKTAPFDMQERYGTSKLLGHIFLAELAERVPASVVTITAANPGLCYGSDLAREGKGSLLGFAFNILSRILGNPTEVGARSITHAATSLGEEVHGQYVEDGVIRPRAPITYTTSYSEAKEVREQLWRETMEELSFAQVREVLREVES